MKKTFIIIYILLAILILLCGCDIRIAPDYYEYEDMEGNKGKADDCMTIKGNLICDLKDGTRLSVRSYKEIYK